MILLNNRLPSKITLAYKSKISEEFYKCTGSAIFEPECRCLILGFGFHHWDKASFPQKLIKEAIKKNIGIIYICDEIPQNYILDDHIVYVVTGFEWFTHLLFKNLTVFKGVFDNNNHDSHRYAEIVADKYRGDFCIPLVKNGSNVYKLDNVITQINKAQKAVLIESFDGLGDVLMSLPSAKTLYDQGYSVSYHVRKDFEAIFKNLEFIDKVFLNFDTITTSAFSRYVSLTNKLSAYSREYNQQNRIYATAYFFNLAPSNLTIHKPIIKLSNDEKKLATNLLKSYTRTVGICWDAHGFNRSYSQQNTQKLCKLIIKKGFIPVILSLSSTKFEGAVNLGGQLSIRQLFSVVWKLDYIITVDTGILHIAGAFDKPIIALMGPIVAEWRCSTYKNCIALTTRAKCYGCSDLQFTPVDKRMCNGEDGYCLRTITPNRIVTKLLKMSKVR